MYLQICAIITDSGQQERQALDSQYGEKKKHLFFKSVSMMLQSGLGFKCTFDSKCDPPILQMQSSVKFEKRGAKSSVYICYRGVIRNVTGS